MIGVANFLFFVFNTLEEAWAVTPCKITVKPLFIEEYIEKSHPWPPYHRAAFCLSGLLQLRNHVVPDIGGGLRAPYHSTRF